MRTRPSSPTRSNTRATSGPPRTTTERRAEVAGELDDEPDARGVDERDARRSSTTRLCGSRAAAPSSPPDRVHRRQVDLALGYDDDPVPRRATRHLEVRTALHPGAIFSCH